MILIMDTITLSATDFRNQLFPLIDRVSRGEIVVTVIKEDTKSKVSVAKAAAKKEKTFAQIAKETHGILKDVPESEWFVESIHGETGKKFLENLRKPW